MHRFAFATFALVLLATTAHAEERNLSNFDGVSAAGRFQVEVTRGPDYRVSVEGPDARHIRTRIHDGVLKIEGARSWFSEPERDAIVRVTSPRIESLAAARGMEMRATGIDARDLSLAAAMGAELTVSGACGALSASTAMGAVIRASELLCETADVSAAMGGSAEVYATVSLDASAAMGGDIEVLGQPARRDVSSAMGGAVNLR